MFLVLDFPFDSLLSPVIIDSNKEADEAALLDSLIPNVWIYFPPSIYKGSLSRFRNRLIIVQDDNKLLAFIPTQEVIDMITVGAKDTVLEDLNISTIDSTHLDESIQKVIRNFLLDMGEECVIIGDTIFEGNPVGVKIHDDWYTIRDGAVKVHDGMITFYYPEAMSNNSEEVDEWDRIVSAATVDKETDPSKFLHNYYESNTKSYEQAIIDIGELWGYTQEDIDSELLSQIY